MPTRRENLVLALIDGEPALGDCLAVSTHQNYHHDCESGEGAIASALHSLADAPPIIGLYSCETGAQCMYSEKRSLAQGYRSQFMNTEKIR